MNLNFINRKEELEFLDQRYQSKTFEFIVIYGRRRIGKTELIKEFVKDKPHIYFLADKRGLDNNMVRFKTQLSRNTKEYAIQSNDPIEIFQDLVNKTNDRLVVVIDEFAYLVEKDDAVSSVFQVLVDEVLKDSKIMLILCGSSVSMMEKGVLSQSSPLYGRKTGHWRVQPLRFSDTTKFFPKNNLIQNIEFWSILGGVPHYLSKFEEKKTMANIENIIIKKGGALYEEVDFLLKEEFREPDTYKAILLAIATGNSKLVNIANSAGIKAYDISKYLKVLIQLEFIKRIQPITAKPKSKKSIYMFNDNFFEFWFRFCEFYKSELEIGETQLVIAKIKKDFNSYLGHKFEEICKQLLRYPKIGKWWGSDGKKNIEIDIVARNENEVLFAECKWKENVDARKVFEELKRKSDFVEIKGKRKYAIFTKSYLQKVKDAELWNLEKIRKIYS